MKRVGPAALLTLAVACSGAAPPVDPDAAATQVTALADAYVRDYLEAFPYQALGIGAPEVHPDRLADHNLPALARWEGREDAILAELKKIDSASIAGRPEAVTYTFLENQLERARDFRTCRMELWNVSPTWTGWQAELPVIAGMQATGTAVDQGWAVARFSEVPKYLDDEIANLRMGIRLGYTAPKNNVQSVMAQVEAMLETPVGDSPFVQMAPKDKKELADFRKQLEELEQTKIRPAIQRYRDFLRDTYLAAAREAIGVSANPNGANCYRAAVRFHATVDMTPKQIHDLGLSQMEKILGEMRVIGARSFGTDDPIKLLQIVKTEARYRFRSRDELIKYAEAAVERARQAVPKYFGRVPKAPVIVGRRQAGQVLDQRVQSDRTEPRGSGIDGVSRGVSGSPSAGRDGARADRAASHLPVFLPFGLRRGLGALHRAAGR
jgi:uncharacterized protein (DUF885 family)